MVCAEPAQEDRVDWLQNNYVVGVALLLLLIVLLIRRKGVRNTPLDWGMLAGFLRGTSPIERLTLDERERAGADMAVQFRDAIGSAKYKRSHRENVRIETLDILRFGEAGFIATFRDEKLIHFTRVGGASIRNPQFSAQQSMILLELLRRVRRLAERK